MSDVLLRDSIEMLQCLKEELQGKVEERTIELLDNAIDDLIKLRDRPWLDAESALRILVLVAEVIGSLPSVISAIDRFFK